MVRNVFYQDLKTSPNQESKVGVKDGVTRPWRHETELRECCIQPYKYSECGGDYDCGFPTKIICIQQEERKQIHATIFFCLYDSSSDGFTSVNVDIWGDATHARWGDFVHSLTHSTRTSAKIRDFWTPSLSLVRISRNLSVLFVHKIWRFFNPLPPWCGRPL